MASLASSGDTRRRTTTYCTLCFHSSSASNLLLCTLWREAQERPARERVNPDMHPQGPLIGACLIHDMNRKLARETVVMDLPTFVQQSLM